MVFFQQCWWVVEVDVMAFFEEFHEIVNLKNPSMLLLVPSSLLGEIGLESTCQPHGIWSQHV